MYFNANRSDDSREPALASSAEHNILKEYTVEESDTLEDIGRKHHLTWEQIAEANRDVLDNPDFVKPGFKLKIPNPRSL